MLTLQRQYVLPVGMVLLALVVAWLLAGCSTIQRMSTQADGQEAVQQDQTPVKLAYGYVTVRETRLRAANLLRLRVIGKEDAQAVQEYCDLARAALDSGRDSFFMGDVRGAEGAVQMVEALLAQASMQMMAKQAQPAVKGGQ